MKILKALLYATVLVVGARGLSHAALFDRGGGLIFDSSLNITWLQNSNLAATEGFGVPEIDVSGRMKWSTANSWIFEMNKANYLGFSDWRLASMDVNSDNSIFNCDGASEEECRDNELAYMYYQNMGGQSGDDLTGDQTIGAITLYGIQRHQWSSTVHDANKAWFFDYFEGDTNYTFKEGNLLSAWAVRPGDSILNPTPEPSTVILLGCGLIGLAGWGRKRFKKI